MLAFELPPIDLIAVDYIGLSQLADVSEKQKDVLRQALGQILPNSKELVDANEAPTAVQSSGIYVRCLQCDPKTDGTPVAIKVIGSEASLTSNGKGAAIKNKVLGILNLGREKQPGMHFQNLKVFRTTGVSTKGISS